MEKGGCLNIHEGEQFAAEMEIVVVCTEIVVVRSRYIQLCVFFSLLNENHQCSPLIVRLSISKNLHEHIIFELHVSMQKRIS